MEEMVAYLEELYEGYKAGNLASKSVNVDNYSRETLTKKLVEVLQSTLEK